MNNLSRKMSQLLQNTAQSINQLSQNFTDARRTYRDRRRHKTLAGGRIEDVVLHWGAQVASGEKFLTKYVVGRGIKKAEAGQPEAPSLLLKQHGVVGYGLRLAFGAVGKPFGVAPVNNALVSFADAAMAGVRFLLIGLVEAVVTALAWGVACGLQGAYDLGNLGVGLTKRRVARFRSPAKNAADAAASAALEAPATA